LADRDTGYPGGRNNWAWGRGEMRIGRVIEGARRKTCRSPTLASTNSKRTALPEPGSAG
jgi:hypothetical protein